MMQAGPAPRAAELVAIAEESEKRLPCSDGDRRIERRLDAAGEPAFVVRACGRRLAFYVDCRTEDPSSAPRRCRVTTTSAPIEIDEAAHPGVHVRMCGEHGWGGPMFEPDGASNGLSMEEFREFALRLQSSVAEVRSVGYGPCLCPKDSTAWCALAYVDPKADFDAAAARIADALTAPGPKMRVRFGVELPKSPH
ncbi:hypothetical protein AKJ09_07728 [Labilithrix luteola]|uniref:Uncharacterized protein n=1 Tax=Labilithrix luteola TaxID=1391654 RepID=A0A0K1Q6M7_9BACT|nr:hypothetical protein [Labilithrix luteola]AKV01065.1 hypothetical protein AKJ09_07728 [Labilithrix luteola]